jgi:hypothetical protein
VEHDLRGVLVNSTYLPESIADVYPTYIPREGGFCLRGSQRRNGRRTEQGGPAWYGPCSVKRLRVKCAGSNYDNSLGLRPPAGNTSS